jgi:hypothetical protein
LIKLMWHWQQWAGKSEPFPLQPSLSHQWFSFVWTNEGTPRRTEISN